MAEQSPVRPTRGAAITGWGAALPETELSSAQMAEQLGISEGWIVKNTGIESRRRAGQAETTSSLATAASIDAVKRAGVIAAELDLVVVATSTPDFQLPGAAPLVQAALGADSAGAYDVNAGCAGFLYALAQATAMIESRGASKVLVCGADVASRVTDPADVGTSVLFADGAGAVVLEAVDAPSRVGPFTLRSDGNHRKLLYIAPETATVSMHGLGVYRHAVNSFVGSVRDVLELAGLTIDDVGHLVPHQANARILEIVASRLGLAPERVVTNVTLVGNTWAGSIPLALAEAADEGRFRDDDVLVISAVGPGFVWGAGVLRWGRPAAGTT